MEDWKERTRLLVGDEMTDHFASSYVAVIGVGGVGRRNMHNMKTENIVALCDVDWKYAMKTFNDYPLMGVHYKRLVVEKVCPSPEGEEIVSSHVKT